MRLLSRKKVENVSGDCQLDDKAKVTEGFQLQEYEDFSVSKDEVINLALNIFGIVGFLKYTENLVIEGLCIRVLVRSLFTYSC